MDSVPVTLKPSTITAVLRALGLGGDGPFTNYHRILNGAVWSARKASAPLLKLSCERFTLGTEALIFGIDDTVERRWGRKLTTRANHRGAVRSICECFQKTSGLRWVSVILRVARRDSHNAQEALHG